ncbi:restriction endonuclease subunit S [Fodinibius sediminis]|uniref:Type I restriction enzyme, S subunit n=1 Tax=Fodinibius sediminis TaxID=1214077 RepID=A0A521AUU5_9BACT|nr:restriction endonuclease subunit S [Fodinibius sediminis]SMO38565.1 type I restriction enzyme, S subunit [Fodinibius sediminis]
MKRVKVSEIIEDPVSGEWGDEPEEECEGVPVIRNTNFSGDGRIDLEDIAYRKISEEKIKEKKLKPGDIIIEKSGGSKNQPVGRVVFFDIQNGDKYLFSNFTSALRPKKSVVPKYVHYGLLHSYLKGQSELYQNKTTGIRNLELNRYLKNTKIPLPEVKRQNEIATQLDQVQRLIDIDDEMQNRYDWLIQSIFLDMFGDPVTNPKGLTEVEFGDLVDMQGGYAFKSDNFIDDAEDGIKVVKIGNVHYIDIDWSEVQYLPSSYLEEHERYSLEEGDILLALTRPIINSLDAVKAVVVHEDDLPALLNQRVARIRVDSDKVTEDYITSFIYTQHFKREIERYASTSLQPNVSMKEVKKIKVLVPSLERQKKFSAIRQRIIEERSALEKSEEKSKELFSSLMQRAFDYE